MLNEQNSIWIPLEFTAALNNLEIGKEVLGVFSLHSGRQCEYIDSEAWIESVEIQVAVVLRTQLMIPLRRFSAGVELKKW